MYCLSGASRCLLDLCAAFASCYNLKCRPLSSTAELQFTAGKNLCTRTSFHVFRDKQPQIQFFPHATLAATTVEEGRAHLRPHEGPLCFPSRFVSSIASSQACPVAQTPAGVCFEKDLRVPDRVQAWGFGVPQGLLRKTRRPSSPATACFAPQPEPSKPFKNSKL